MFRLRLKQIFLLVILIPAFSGRAADKQVIRNAFNQFYKLSQFKAPDGRCIYIRAAVKVKDHNDKTLVNADLEIIRGDAAQFKLLINMQKSPLGGELTNLTLGCDPAPWILSGRGTLYTGQLEARKDSFPAKYFVAQVARFQQLLSGVFAMAASGTLAVLDKQVKIEMKRDNAGRPYVNIQERKTRAKIYLDPATGVPQKIFINYKTFKAEIVFERWDLTAPVSPGIFSPADNKNRKIVKVKQYDLDKMFAALVNFAAGKTQRQGF